MSAAVKTLASREIEAVTGAGPVGYVGGFLTAIALGANVEQAHEVGKKVSDVEDALNG